LLVNLQVFLLQAPFFYSFSQFSGTGHRLEPFQALLLLGRTQLTFRLLPGSEGAAVKR
jgi:hypothetical protein